MRDFTKQLIWQRSHALALAIHCVSLGLRQKGHAGLASQLRRAAESVPTNIVEGCGKSSVREFRRFLEIAAGSAAEVEYHLIYSRDLSALSVSVVDPLIQEIREIRRMIVGYINVLTAELEQRPYPRAAES